jgi:citrate lyase alpha subunit
MLRVVDMTRIDSSVIFNPNRDIVEDRKTKSGLSIKDIATVLNRAKLLIFLFKYIQSIDRPVIYHDYPRFSFFIFFVRYFILI